MNEFKCEKCSSNKLAYQKFVKCLSDVDIDGNGTIHYGQSEIDEDNWVGAEYGFVCQDCGNKFYHAGQLLTTEDDLIRHLNADPEVLVDEQKQFDRYLEEQIILQEQEEKDRNEYYKNIKE